MPSPHRRIGLVVDEPVDDVLDLFRERTQERLPEARIARMAVVEGALVEATMKLARSSDARDRDRAAHLVAGLEEIVPDLPLPGLLKDELLASLREARSRPSRAERRRRQLALVRSAERRPTGQTAQDLADTFDAFERMPSR
jgi:hypothetical protein